VTLIAQPVKNDRIDIVANVLNMTPNIISLCFMQMSPKFSRFIQQTDTTWFANVGTRKGNHQKDLYAALQR
jgi:hypothetical protein